MRRIYVEVIILLIVAIIVVVVGYRYFFVATTPAPIITTEPIMPIIDFVAVKKIVRETPAGEILTDDWTPEKLSARWEMIIIHHSASVKGNAKNFATHHQNRGMNNGMAYHFVICNGFGGEDGQVEIGNRWLEQLDGGHVRGDQLNHVAIGICLVGDFTKYMPTTKQIASLKALLLHLQKLVNIKKIIGHQNAPAQATNCPGYLPISELTE